MQSSVGFSDFVYFDAVDIQHQFTFDDIIFGAVAFGVFYDFMSCRVVGIDEVGDISATLLKQDADRSAFQVSATLAVLRRYEGERHLLAEVGDKSGALHQFELSRATMLLA